MNWESWNPITGCDRISPGCDHCYALNRAAILKRDGSPRYQKDGDPRSSGPGFGLTLHPDKLDNPLHWRKSRKIFVNSMSDIFHKDVPLTYIQKIFRVIEETPEHTYHIITKRSKRMLQLSPSLPWPPNLRISVTVEQQQYAFRVKHLLGVPAALRGINAEPLLGYLTLDLTDIDWVHCGGETEIGYRECQPAWVRHLRDQCVAGNVAFAFSHWSGLHPGDHGCTLDGTIWDQAPPIVHPLLGHPLSK